MSGGSPYRRSSRREESSPRWRRSRPSRTAPALDQEDEVRAKLYAKPPATERTVEVLGPVERMAERPAA